MRERAAESERPSDRSLTLRKFLFLFFILLIVTACAPQPAPHATPIPADTPQDIGFCTADVQECPDGSFVSRVAPDCDFAPCPQ